MPTLGKKNLPLVLVCGGAGFLGAALCQRLLAEGDAVLAIDNLKSGQQKHLENLKPHPHFLFWEQDLNQTDFLILLKKRFSHLGRLEAVFYLAGIEEYLTDSQKSLETLLVNSHGLENILEFVRQTKVKFLLGSTLSVFSGFLPTQKFDPSLNLKEFLATSHHEAKRFAEVLTASYLGQYQINARVARLGQVYGPGMDLTSENPFSRLIRQAKEGEPMVIEGDGLDYFYPVFVTDLVEGLMRAMFSPQTEGKIYSFFGPPVTALNLAKLCQKLSPEPLKILFTRSTDNLTFTFPQDLGKTSAALDWQPKIKIEEGLKPILAPQRFLPQMAEVIPSAVKTAVSPQPKLSLKPRFFWRWSYLTFFLLGLAFLFGLFYPLFGLAWEVFWGVKDLESLSQKATAWSPQRVELKAFAAKKHFQQAEIERQRLEWLFFLLGQKKIATAWDNYFSLAENLAEGSESLALSGQILLRSTKVIFGQEEGQLAEKIIEAKSELGRTAQIWGMVLAQLKSQKAEKDQLPFGWGKKLTQNQEKLSRLPQALDQGQKILQILPEIIAQDSQKTYLLLLQNNTELRPTGGFIGSYGLVRFRQGKLAELKIEDVYQADGQLKGHVEPPQPIKNYLKEHWFLRDSNWDPDFSQSAQRAQWFLEKEIGQKTEGVLAFDLGLIQNLLSTTGPIALPDYQETITAQNLFEKAERYSEIDFFPGSTQKRDFLGALARKLLERVTTGRDLKWLEIGQALANSLAEKHLLVYFSDPNTQKIFSDFNWTGQISQKPSTDYLFLVEANLGINKANYFLKRKILSEVTIGKMAEMTKKVVLEYENKSPTSTWPAGSYRSYFRAYLPEGSFGEKIELDGASVLEKTVATEAGKTVLGFFFEVPVKSQRQIAITYRLPQKLPFEFEKGFYDLYFQKQPGTSGDSLTVVVNYPSYLRVQKTDPKGSVGNQTLIWQTDTATDRKFWVEFGK